MNRQIILNKRISLRIMPQFKVYRSDYLIYETVHNLTLLTLLTLRK